MGLLPLRNWEGCEIREKMGSSLIAEALEALGIGLWKSELAPHRYSYSGSHGTFPAAVSVPHVRHLTEHNLGPWTEEETEALRREAKSLGQSCA